MSRAANASMTNGVLPWHATPQHEVVKRLATSCEKGLDPAEAAVRLQKYGPNRLPEGRKRGPFARLLAQFNNVLVYVLLAAGFTKLMLNLWVDAAIILAVVVLNALLGFIQEGKAEKALDSIRNMLSAEARTVRGGETRIIPAEQLVPGDVVLLESGDKIPADLRLFETKNLRTEEAALTGESVPAEKNVDAVPANATVGDRESMAFSGTWSYPVAPRDWSSRPAMRRNSAVSTNCSPTLARSRLRCYARSRNSATPSLRRSG
jgi:magnesium-transporting ATPase (P-type)